MAHNFLEELLLGGTVQAGARSFISVITIMLAFRFWKTRQVGIGV